MKNPLNIFALALKAARPANIEQMVAVSDNVWLRSNYAAMMFFGTIIAHTPAEAQALSSGDSRIRRHETIHLRQAQATHNSFLLFYLLYAYYYTAALPHCLRHPHLAYLSNPFELEAYAHEDDAAYVCATRIGGAHQWRHFARMTTAQRLAMAGR